MALRIRLLAALTALALLLVACGGQPAAQAPEPSTTAVLATEPIVAAPPTPTFEQLTDEDTRPAVSGALDWRDAVVRGDGLSIRVSGLDTPAAGEAYLAWLNDGAVSTLLGPLQLDGPNATLDYTSPAQLNLLANFEQLYIARQPAGDTEQVGTVLLSGGLPAGALIHIRHVLSGIGVTPGGVGFGVGLRGQSDELLRHAQFLRDAQEAGDFPLVRVHAEHVINIIRGSEARDANGDGEAQNPGDGFGLLPNGAQDGYIKATADHARLAAEAADATEAIKLHSGHVQVAAENSRQRTEQIRALAERILGAQGVDASRADALELLSLAEQLLQGVDADRDEQVEPAPGEGGVLTAYQHAQLMAGVALAPAGSEIAPSVAADDHSAHGGDHAAVPTTSPAAPSAPTAPPAPPTAPGVVEVQIGDNSFTPANLTIPAGTTVIWRHVGQRPHTVTAADNSFASGTLKNGDSFSQRFDTPGSFDYLCEFHEGMAGTITVTSDVPAPAASAPAAPAPGELRIVMRDFAFEPREIRVRVGQSVIWRNEGTKQHSATAVDGSFDTGLYGPGEERSLSFSTPGTFAYYCVLHAPADGASGMAGTIIVEP